MEEMLRQAMGQWIFDREVDALDEMMVIMNSINAT